MRIATAAVAALSLAASGAAAVAAPVQLSDAQFLTANRCMGLLTSSRLSDGDTATMRQLLASQTIGRPDYIADRADQMRQDAEAQANRAGAGRLTDLTAERDGVCHSLIANTTTTSASRGTSSSIR